MQPMLPAAITSGANPSRFLRLAVAQFFRDFGLQQIVGSRRAAAEMALRRIEHDKTRLLQQLSRQARDFLAVLQRAGAVIGDARSARRDRRLKADLGDEFGDVARERGDLCRLVAQLRVVAEHEAVVLHRRPAAGGVDDDGVEPGAFDFAAPRQDVPSRQSETVILAEMMVERAATARAFRDDNLTAVARQQPQRGGVDLRRQNFLRAAGEQRHAPDFCDGRRDDAGTVAGEIGTRPRRHGKDVAAVFPAQVAERFLRSQRPEAPAGTDAGRGSVTPSIRGTAGRTRVFCTFFRCGGGRGRPNACSSRPTGTWSCTTGRTGSGRYA